MRSIAIITGGTNSEREISLISAAAVKEGLEKLTKYTIFWYDLPTDRSKLLADLELHAFSFAFVIIHGKGGEDGQVSTLLDLYGIPTQCASRETLLLTMNKRRTKLVRRAQGLPVADDLLISPVQIKYANLLDRIQKNIWFPCVRKELDQGSSKGVHILTDEWSLQKTRKNYATFAGPILIEAYITGEEITIPLLDYPDGTTHVLPLIHIIPPEGQEFDYQNKYNGQTQEICPSGFPEETVRQVNQIALDAYHAVGCSRYARIDAILTDQWPILLEINTIPWFTAQSLFPKAAQAVGLSFPALLEHLIRLAD